MFGKHKIPFSTATDRLTLHVESRKDGIFYQRTIDGAKVEKLVFASMKSIHIAPVEPLNLPKEIARQILIQFDVPILVEPKGKAEVYLTFPLEIGVFMDKGGGELIDVFSLVQPHFTLYGDPRTGTLCRYWKSPVLSEAGSTRPFHEGNLQLRVKNSWGGWVKLSRVVIDAVSMKIFYKKDLVGLKVEANLLSSTTAEIWCPGSPLVEGMHKSEELYEGKKLTLGDHKFIMRNGL